MLFGDPTDFAIEATVEPDLVPPSAVWGRMRLISGELRLGDFSNPYCALYPAYRHFQALLWMTTPLWDLAFNGKSLEEIHDMVQHAIYGDDDRTLGEIRCASKRFAPYDFLTNWGEQFDGYSAVVVQPSWDSVAILHRPHASPHDFRVAHCSFDCFRTASMDFVKWFDAEQQRLQA